MLIGLDIGGANLKASDGEQTSVSRPFPIWRRPERLADELRTLIEPWPAWSTLAVTMTAELADCFATKAEGVDVILRAVQDVAAGREILVWQSGGEFVTPDEARELPRLVAAANWHALATWAGRIAGREPGLLIDIGSTTTDIISIVEGLPDPCGRTDLERLISGELLYFGVRRTPLCAIAQAATVHERPCPLAAELFATSLDLFLLTGDLPEDVSSTDTADGRPGTKEAAHSRLAHQFCCDAAELDAATAKAISHELKTILLMRLSAAIERVASRLPDQCRTLLLCGEGEFLAREAVSGMSAMMHARTTSLSSVLGAAHSSAACAYALARLGRERRAG